MKYSSSFTYDLKLGEESEDWAKELFEGKVKIEVKVDSAAHRTGNIFIEVYSRGKHSGISTTTADFWVYKIHRYDSAIIISVDRLKFLVKRHFNGEFKKGGDNDSSLGVVIPLKELFT
jgi:hypothetical protein